MTLNELSWTSFPYVELAPGELRDGETVLHHWPSHLGMGVLTNLRVLLTTHPHPVHRTVFWSEDLEKIESFRVRECPKESLPTFFGALFPSGFLRGGVAWDRLDDYYAVSVDNVTVFVGYVEHCVDIQKWLDETRVARLEALGWPIPPGGSSERPTLPPDEQRP